MDVSWGLNHMTTKQGYTLVEVLVCISIIATLAAVLGLAVPGALRSARGARAIGHMRQIAVAVKLYQEEWGRIPTINNVEKPNVTSWGKRFGLPEETFIGCGSHTNNPFTYSIVYFYISDKWPYEEWLVTYGDSLPVAFDVNCSDPAVHVGNPYEPKLALAVNLGGTALRRRRAGDPWQASFWLERE